MRRFKWFKVLEGGTLQFVSIEKLLEDQTKKFGFCVPKTPKFKSALLKTSRQSEVKPVFVELENCYAVIFEPEVGVWLARKFRTLLTKNLKK